MKEKNRINNLFCTFGTKMNNGRKVENVFYISSMLEKDEVKETILDVASTIFSKFGFKKTTMDEIAQAARKGKSSVYYYFSGKEEIFKAVVEREGLLLKNTLRDVVLSDLLPEEKLRKYILTRLLAIKELSNLYNAVKNDLLSHIAFIVDLRNSYDQEETIMISQIINEGIEKKIFLIDNAQTCVSSIIQITKGLEFPIFLFDKDNHLENKINDILNLIFNGILNKNQ